MRDRYLTGFSRVAFLVAVTCSLAALSATTASALDKAQRDMAREGSYLVREIGHQLRLLPYYSVFDDIEYRVEGYNVELDGAVTRPTLKHDAENVVKHIEGVETVTNNIKVLPPSSSDDHIRLAEFRAIYGQATLNRYALQAVPPIHIIVDMGHVTLVGVVANAMDRNVTGIQANSVPGVFSVTNNLQVENK
jgi:hyperosmotically inducible periplasmic protein